MTAPLSGTAVVLSPHLDDGVFSLGAAIAKATSDGVAVRVLTVLAGDPDSEREAGPWDREAGFATEGEAARARRQEDRRACGIVGAEPLWLPFGDETYGRRASDDEIWEAIESAAGDADALLVPGWPLAHTDHQWLARLALARARVGRLLLYVEQPYAAIKRGLGRPGETQRPTEVVVEDSWSPLPADRRHRSLKRRAWLLPAKAAALLWPKTTTSQQKGRRPNWKQRSGKIQLRTIIPKVLIKWCLR